jgi:hypothetical protein
MKAAQEKTNRVTILVKRKLFYFHVFHIIACGKCGKCVLLASPSVEN